VAVWGAGLATLLGIRELQKEKRQIRVYIDFLPWYSIYEISIVNIGLRPVNIVSACVHLKPKDKSQYGIFEGRPFEPELFVKDKQPLLPVRLNDGENITLVMGKEFLEPASSGQFEIMAYARDAEGNTYISTKQRSIDTKHDMYIPRGK
jgi:hypothetical protein